MAEDSALLPKVYQEGLLKLGYLVANPVYPNLQLFEPPPEVGERLKELEIKGPPQPANVLHFGVAKRGWFSLQLVRLLGIHSQITARTLLTVESGETEREIFKDIHAAYTTVFAAEETQTWINKVSKTMGKVYLIVGIDHISGARVKGGLVHSAGAEAFVHVPLEQLGQKSMELKGGFSWEDFGLHDLENVTGIFGVQYYEVKIRSGKAVSSPGSQSKPKLSWVRPATVVMGTGSEETVMEVSLEGKLDMEALHQMMQEEMEDDDGDDDE